MLGGSSHADSGVGPDDAHPENPLGGGDYGRCRCPLSGPGQRMISALHKGV